MNQQPSTTSPSSAALDPGSAASAQQSPTRRIIRRTNAPYSSVNPVVTSTTTVQRSSESPSTSPSQSPSTTPPANRQPVSDFPTQPLQQQQLLLQQQQTQTQYPDDQAAVPSGEPQQQQQHRRHTHSAPSSVASTATAASSSRDIRGVPVTTPAAPPGVMLGAPPSDYRDPDSGDDNNNENDDSGSARAPPAALGNSGHTQRTTFGAAAPAPQSPQRYEACHGTGDTYSESGSIAASGLSVLVPQLVSASPVWKRHGSLLHRFLSPYNSLMQIIAALDHESEGGKMVRTVPRHLFAADASSSSSSSAARQRRRHTFVDGRYFVLHVERCARYLYGDGTWFLTQTLPEHLKELAIDIALELFDVVDGSGSSSTADGGMQSSSSATTFVFPGLSIVGGTAEHMTQIDHAQLKLQEDVWRRGAQVDEDTSLIAFSPSPEGAGFPFGQDVVRMFGRLLKQCGFDVVTAPYSQHAQMVAMALAMNHGQSGDGDGNGAVETVLFGPPELLLYEHAHSVVLARDAHVSLVADKEQLLSFLFLTPQQQQAQAERTAAAAERAISGLTRRTISTLTRRTISTVTRRTVSNLTRRSDGGSPEDGDVLAESGPGQEGADEAAAAAEGEAPNNSNGNDDGGGAVDPKNDSGPIPAEASGAYEGMSAHPSMEAAGAGGAASSINSGGVSPTYAGFAAMSVGSCLDPTTLTPEELHTAWVDLGLLVSSLPTFWMLRPNLMGSAHRLAERPALLLAWFRQKALCAAPRAATQQHQQQAAENAEPASASADADQAASSSTPSSDASLHVYYSIDPLLDAVVADCNPALAASDDVQDKVELQAQVHHERRKMMRGRAFILHNPVYCPAVADCRLVPLSQVVAAAATTTAQPSLSSSSTTAEAAATTPSARFADDAPPDCHRLFGARFPFALLMSLMSGLLSPRTVQLAAQQVLRDSRFVCDTYLLRRCMGRFVALDGSALKVLYDRLAADQPAYAQLWRHQVWVRWFMPCVQPMSLAQLDPPRREAFAIANWSQEKKVAAQQQQQQQQVQASSHHHDAAAHSVDNESLLTESFGRPDTTTADGSRNDSFSYGSAAPSTGFGVGIAAAFGAGIDEPPLRVQDPTDASFGGTAAVRSAAGVGDTRKSPLQSQTLMRIIDDVVMNNLDVHLAAPKPPPRSPPNNAATATAEDAHDADDSRSTPAAALSTAVSSLSEHPPLRRTATNQFLHNGDGRESDGEQQQQQHEQQHVDNGDAVLPSSARYLRRTELGHFPMQTFTECALVTGADNIRQNPFHNVGAAMAAAHIHALDVLGYLREHPRSGLLSIDTFGEALLFAARRYPHIPFDALQLLFELCRVHALTPGKVTNVTPASFDPGSTGGSGAGADGEFPMVEPVAVCRASAEVSRMHIATRIACVLPLVCRTQWQQAPDRDALAFLCLVRRLMRSLRGVYEITAACVVLDQRFKSASAAVDDASGAADEEEEEKEAALVQSFLAAAELQTPFELPLSTITAMVVRALFDDHLVAGGSNNSAARDANEASNARSGGGGGAKSLADLVAIFPQLPDCVISPRGSQLAPAVADSLQQPPQQRLERAAAILHSVFEFFFVAGSLLRRARRIAHNLPAQDVSRTLLECLNEMARPLADAEEVMLHKAKLLLGRDYTAERNLFD